MPLKNTWVDGESYNSAAVNAVADAINAFGTAPAGAVVGTTDAQALTQKTISGSTISAFGQEITLFNFADTSKTAQIILPNGQTASTQKTHTLPIDNSTLASLALAEIFQNKTIDGTNNTLTVRAADIPNGITNGNTSAQSQLVVSATSYYIAGSNLNLPATLKAGMAVGTRFRWRVAMAKTNAGTGAFAIEIRRGTAGTVADTADVSQSIGTQTAVVDSMVVDVEMVVTTTGATGAYFWSIIPVNKAVTATGFGVATGATGQFSGTVSSVAMNTASLKFGLSFKATTGTPTITVPMVQASAINIS